MREPTVGECAYAAGFFDGEGCVSIECRKTKDRARNWRVSLKISQVDPTPLLFLQGIWGGSMLHRRPGSSNIKPFYQWSIHTAKADAFLRAIYPFAIVKKDEVGIALEFRDRIGNSHFVGRRGVPEEEHLRRADLKARIHACINRRKKREISNG